MDDPSKSEDEKPAARRVFHLQLAGDADALMQVLSPFAGQGIALQAVEFRGPSSVRIESAALNERQNSGLVAGLRALPVVRSIGFGWRADRDREG